MLRHGQAVAEEAIPTPVAGEKPAGSPPQKAVYRRIGLLLAALLAACTYLGYSILHPVVEGCTDRNSLTYNPEANRDDGSCRYPDPDTAVIGCLDPAAINFDPEAARACSGCCNYTGCMDSSAVNFNPKATIPCDDCCEQTPERKLASIAKLTEGDSTTHLIPFVKREYAVPYIKPLEDRWAFAVYRRKDLITWVLAGSIFAFFLAGYLFRRARRSFVARRERGEEPPYVLPIKVGADTKLMFRDSFDRLLNYFRSREAGERRILDVPLTVRATARQGGGLQFRFRPMSRPAEFLFLIDKDSEQNHRAHLADEFFGLIRRDEVYAERYFFDGNPAICWNDDSVAGISLERLMQKHHGARLLIFADGYSFIDPVTGELEPWVPALDYWPQRILVTPVPSAAWGFRERLLGSMFGLLPNTEEGLLRLSAIFAGEKEVRLEEWKYYLGKEDKAILLPDDDVVGALKAHFSTPVCNWIAACAVYPELHWDLTMQIGYLLEGEAEGTLVTYGNVRKLSQLEWFQKGEIPASAREALVASLDKGLQQRVREALLKILEQNSPADENSYAFEEYQLHLAINQLLVRQLPAERQKWLEIYRDQHQKGLREDYVAVRELDERFNRLLDFELPAGFRRVFYREGRRSLGQKNWVPLLSGLALVLLLCAVNFFWYQPCFEKRHSLTIPGEPGHTCLHNASDSLNYFTRKAIYHTRRFEIDSVLLLEGQLGGLPLDSLDNVFNFNVKWAAYDAAVEYYQAGAFVNATELLERLFRRFQGPDFADDFRVGDAFHLLGVCYFYQGDRQAGLEMESLLASNPAYAAQMGAPNLSLFLEYDFVDSVVMDHIRVRKEGRYGFLDRGGAPGWATRDGALPFDHAFNYTADSIALIMEKEIQCFIDWHGLRLSKSCFAQPVPFQEEGSGKWGFENGNGIIIIDPVYDEVEAFNSSELALVKKDGKYGFIRKNGEPCIPIQFDSADDFAQGLANVRKGSRWGYYNTDGKLIIPLRFEVAEPFDQSGAARVELNGIAFRINRVGDCISGNNCPRLDFVITVLDARSGEPVAGATLSHQNQIFKRTATDAAGAATFAVFEHLLPMFPTFRLEAEGYHTLDQRIVLQRGRNPRPVRLSPVGEVDLDRDGDGINNLEDACPDDAGTLATFGCPDSDRDGVMDREDQCPTTPGSKEFAGCPATAQEPDLEGKGTGGGIAMDPEGHTYTTLEIGGRTWLAENLATDLAGSYSYADQPQKTLSYGRLYTWQAAEEACRSLGEEWRLPTRADWEALTAEFGGRGTRAYAKLLEDKSVGFGARLGGYRAENQFVYEGLYGYYWTSDDHTKATAWFYKFGKQTARLDRGYGPQSYANSVRCIRD